MQKEINSTKKLEVKNHNWIWIIGLMILLIGILFSIILLQDYHSKVLVGIHFKKENNFQDLGTVLAGTVGIIFNIASILFFVYTLVQTRQDINLQRMEMADTRVVLEKQQKSITQQQTETTFFNLINNHTRLVEKISFKKVGYEGLNELVSELTSLLATYKRGITIQQFDKTIYTSWHPGDIYHGNKDLSTIYYSIVNIAKFISDKMDDNTLYHEILYNSLTGSEKFIVGMVIENNLSKKFDFSFSYNSYFLKNSEYRNITLDGYIPNLYLINIRANELNKELDLNTNNKMFQKYFNFEIKYTTFDKNFYDLKLTGLEVITSGYYDGTTNDTINKITFNENLSELKFNLADLYYNNIIEPIILRTKHVKQSYTLKSSILLYVESGGVHFDIYTKMETYFRVNKENSKYEFRLHIEN